MDKTDHAAYGFREMDELAARQSPVHSLHPLAKLITTFVYIFVTVSFHRYDLSGLIVMVLYPALMFTVSGIPAGTCFYKLRFVLPLVLAVGLFNPFFDREPLLTIGSLGISGGMISMTTLMLKGIFCLTASFLLAATTPMDSVCAALRKIRVPGMIVTLLLLTYRYISVMLEELSVMTTAYKLRAPGQKGIRYNAWGSFLGQLLLRTMDRGQELFESMQLRGFQGEFWYADVKKARMTDYLFTIVTVILLVLCRRCSIADLAGSLVTGGAV